MHIRDFLAFNICLFITDKEILFYFWIHNHLYMKICEILTIDIHLSFEPDSTGIDRQGD